MASDDEPVTSSSLAATTSLRTLPTLGTLVTAVTNQDTAHPDKAVTASTCDDAPSDGEVGQRECQVTTPCTTMINGEASATVDGQHQPSLVSAASTL